VPGLARVALAPAQPAWFVIIVVAVLASAGEFQHHTTRTTLLATPQRLRVMAAKSLTGAGIGAATVAGAAATAVLTSSVTQLVTGAPITIGPARDWAAAGGSMVVGAIWAVLATGLGVLTRSTAASITVVLLWRFVGEVLVPALTRNPGLTRWTPSGAADALVGLGGPNVLPIPAAGALLVALTLVICGTAGVLFVRSDPA
jgi:ABC-2 type transport system permease protein